MTCAHRRVRMGTMHTMVSDEANDETSDHVIELWAYCADCGARARFVDVPRGRSPSEIEPPEYPRASLPGDALWTRVEFDLPPAC